MLVLSKIHKDQSDNKILSEEHFKCEKYSKLKMKDPKSYSKGSMKKVTWMCDCGKEKSIIIYNVICGRTTSCGQCNMMPASYWKEEKFGKLRMKDPKPYFKSHKKKVTWMCDCGNETNIKLSEVTSGHSSSCGKCNVLPISHWENTKYGRLKMYPPLNMHFGSNKKVHWVCDCGGTTNATVINVTRGRQTSCGKCNNSIKEWFKKNKETINTLKTPISPEQIPLGGLVLLKEIKKAGDKIEAVCPACKNQYKTRWTDFKSGKSLTCGCSTNRISAGQHQIKEFIKSIGFDTISEYQVNDLKYDIFIPGQNTLIEYNGLRWHSFQDSKRKDIKKYLNALKHGFKFISIFEDEWINSKSKVKNFLINCFKKSNAINLRPTKCRIEKIHCKTADKFYKQHHYIGPSKAKINYGVYYNEKLISCTSFKKPTRQSIHDYELVRMSSDPDFRIHGIWSKLLKQFINEYNPSSIVSFSDNRLFTGSVYEKIGFKFDGNVSPDYYWCKGQKRFHKSSLRKTKEEKLTGLTETKIRESQGYKKTWDLGKKRWVLICNNF